ncbi:hypothetical protein BD779DRAFT_1566644 [Infundibulicybe gibba]|nr:hypothetical protein BD779DRAFT_1566644 [Infundibulicybe gibba]
MSASVSSLSAAPTAPAIPLPGPATTIEVGLAGPIFIGIILNWCLLGSLAVQVYIYYLSSRSDRFGLKFLVYFVFVADLIQSGTATDHAWKTLVTFWGDPEILSKVPKTAITLTIMNGIISAIVQIFFAWRIWFLNKTVIGRAFAVLIVLIALMQSLSTLISSIRFTVMSGDLSILPSVTTGFTVWLAGSFAADILIAGSMLYILGKARAQSFSKRTETMVSKLMANTIQTGAVTAIAAGVELILFLVYKNNNYHEAPAFLLGKLYSNVLLANLNARVQNKRLGDDVQFMSTAHSSENARSETAVRITKLSQRKTVSDDDVEMGIVRVHKEVVSDAGGFEGKPSSL